MEVFTYSVDGNKRVDDGKSGYTSAWTKIVVVASGKMFATIFCQHVGTVETTYNFHIQADRRGERAL